MTALERAAIEWAKADLRVSAITLSIVDTEDWQKPHPELAKARDEMYAARATLLAKAIPYLNGTKQRRGGK